MTDLMRTIAMFLVLRQSTVLILLGLLGAVFAVPAGAATISYQLDGTIGGDGGTIFDNNTGNPTTDTVFVAPDPFPSSVSFSLSFDLDNSVAGTAAGSNGSNFAAAISNLVLTVDGSTFYTSSSEDLDEFDNGSNHQWSVFGFAGTFSTSVEFVDIEDSNGIGVDSLQLASMDLILLDLDAALFSQSPPELVAITGNEFEIADIDLTWSGGATYDYGVTGTINTITTSAVPLPGSIWLFGSALLGLSGIAKRKKV